MSSATVTALSSARRATARTEISRALAEQQVYLAELRPRESTLEEFFLEVTGEPVTES